jgi:hypothetical protein
LMILLKKLITPQKVKTTIQAFPGALISLPCPIYLNWQPIKSISFAFPIDVRTASKFRIDMVPDRKLDRNCLYSPWNRQKVEVLTNLPRIGTTTQKRKDIS